MKRYSVFKQCGKASLVTDHFKDIFKSYTGKKSFACKECWKISSSVPVEDMKEPSIEKPYVLYPSYVGKHSVSLLFEYIRGFTLKTDHVCVKNKGVFSHIWNNLPCRETL